MRNQGQITVFLSLILISLLVLFLAAIGVVEFHMDRARVSEAAKGASEHIKADYQEQIFEEYHEHWKTECFVIWIIHFRHMDFRYKMSVLPE